MIWDSHTHWGNYWEDRFGSEPSAWIEACEKKGVTHTVVLPGRGLMDATAVKQGNDVLNALAGKSDGRIIAFCIVNLWSLDEALGELARCAAMDHIRGIKLHPWLQGTSILSPVTEAVCDFAGKHDLPILFHDGTPCFGIPSQIGVLARRHPKATLILGHAGMFEYWREAIHTMEYAKNVWGCLCSPQLSGIRGLLASADRRRILWGSDYGFGSPTSDCIGYRLKMLDRAPLEASVRHAVLTENPHRLFQV